MMQTYTIKRDGELVATYRRRDLAAKRFADLAYDTVRSFAGLDTHWGHRAVNAARAAIVSKRGATESPRVQTVIVQGVALTISN